MATYRGRIATAIAATSLVVVGTGCINRAHDVSCQTFLEMAADEQAEVVQSFLDDHPLGRLAFGSDQDAQKMLASPALQGYCSQHLGENIMDLEPDLVPGV